MTSLLGCYLGKVCLVLLVSLCPITELRADWKIERKPVEIEQLTSQSGKIYMIDWLGSAARFSLFFAYRKELQYYRDHEPDYERYETHQRLTRIFDWRSARETLRIILQRHLGDYLLLREKTTKPKWGNYISIIMLADLEGKMLGVILEAWADRGAISADIFEAIENDILASGIKLGYLHQGNPKFFGQSSFGKFMFTIQTDSILEGLERLKEKSDPNDERKRGSYGEADWLEDSPPAVSPQSKL